MDREDRREARGIGGAGKALSGNGSELECSFSLGPGAAPGCELHHRVGWTSLAIYSLRLSLAVGFSGTGKGSLSGQGGSWFTMELQANIHTPVGWANGPEKGVRWATPTTEVDHEFCLAILCLRVK